MLGTLWLLVVIVPIYYMVLTSFRSQTQYLSANAWLPTGGLSLSSWAAVFSSTGLWRRTYQQRYLCCRDDRRRSRSVIICGLPDRPTGVALCRRLFSM